ncbi:MAG: hypothetical protein AABX77_03115 [Nanoarchaeota archaeon]
MEKIYRFTTNGEGVFSAGKRLLPKNLIDEANENRKWLVKPALHDGNYRFYLTEKGKKKYEETLMLTHKKYLPDIKLEIINKNNLNKIIYEDDFQVVDEVKNGK